MHVKRSSRVMSREHQWLGEAVRELRGRQRLSQEQLGEQSGLHRNYVGALERGEINATFRTLLRIARGLGESIGFVIAHYEETAERRRNGG